MDKQATIRDVAEKAGVSIATASRVLSKANYPVSPELRKKVERAAQQMEYIPNAMARSLRTEYCNDIGLVIPNLSNPFYLQSMMGINDILTKHGYSTILCDTMRNPTKEQAFLRQLLERKTKGIILSSVDENADTVNELSRKGVRFVLLDQKLTGSDCTGIICDSRAGTKMSTSHLISLGHRRIAFATMSMKRWTRQEMYHGYCDALSDAGIPYDPSLIYEHTLSPHQEKNEWELESGRCIAEAFIRDGCPATGIICINDMVAIGVIKVFLQHGIRVPEDVSVFGFDDIPFAEAFHPSLSTVHYPAKESGRLAAMMLVDMLTSHSSESPVSMNLELKLMLRDTVAPPKNT